MSRRSSRRVRSKKSSTLPAGTVRGLASLIEGNESLISKMLSVDNLPADQDEARTKLMASITDCMSVNNLSAEALLARFFDAKVLSVYCDRRLGVSAKGNEATLAARIAKAWSKDTFTPLPLTGESPSASAAETLSKTKEKKGTNRIINEQEDEDESAPAKKKVKGADQP